MFSRWTGHSPVCMETKHDHTLNTAASNKPVARHPTRRTKSPHDAVTSSLKKEVHVDLRGMSSSSIRDDVSLISRWSSQSVFDAMQSQRRWYSTNANPRFTGDIRKYLHELTCSQQDILGFPLTGRQIRISIISRFRHDVSRTAYKRAWHLSVCIPLSLSSKHHQSHQP